MRSMIIAFFLILASCGPQPNRQTSLENETAIFGGQEIDLHHPIGPHMVGLIDESINALCTGTLIAEDLILTASHCINPQTQSLAVFFSNRVSRQVAPPFVVRTKRFVRHPQFSIRLFGNSHDIALIHLTTPLPPGYRPIELTTDFSTYGRRGQNLVAAGFGRAGRFFNEGNGVLRTLEVPFRSHFTGTEFTTPQGLFKGVCAGDSGGPIFVNDHGKWTQAGVISRSLNFILPCTGILIITRVDQYHDWLSKAASELRTRP